MAGRNSHPARSKPANGMTEKIKLSSNSSFRKLARAIHQDRVPDERQAIIDVALRNAVKNATKYANKKRGKS